MIRSPYNFVPLSDKVVSPYWTKHVSHDIPFDDAQSGTLELTLKAESDIFVRNGAAQNSTEQALHEFSNMNGEYFIPGSSVQGALRGVLEIMSFGRMANKVNDHRYSVRDFQNPDIYPIAEISQTVSCGWLKKENGEYLLQDCGEPGRISHEKIDAEFKTGMSAFFQNQANVRPNAKSAKFKCDKFPTVKGVKSFTGTKVVLRYICDFAAGGAGEKGEIVMTGQPGHRFFNERRNVWEGKHLEFVFFQTGNSFETVKDTIIQNFFFAYYDHDKNAQKDDWKWRKPQLDDGKAIPVFFRKDSSGKVIDMGLSYLYKITYNNSIKESIDKTQGKAQNFDLAETIFGYTEGKHDFLKSRVHIGHAFAVERTAQVGGVKNEVLSGPKASYYPNYIAQKIKNEGTVKEYNTFMNEKAQIAGWKRYPVQHSVKRNPAPLINGVVNTKVTTTFIPLKKGATFQLSISYHNLKKEELGALISAITFHNTNGLFHSIGMAKPLGYGKTTITIDNIDENLKTECLKAFETYMNIALGFNNPQWHHSVQLKELFAMAKGHEGDETPYMSLDKREESFVSAKKAKEALEPFSVISNNNINIATLTNDSNIQTEKQKHNALKAVLEKAKPIKDLEKDLNKKTKQDIEARIDMQKNAFLKFLEEKRTFLQKQENESIAQEAKAQEEAHKEAERLEAERIRNEKAGNAMNEPFVTTANDFKTLSTNALVRGKKVRADNNEDRLKKNHPEGYLLEQDYGTVFSTLGSIFNKLKPKEQAEWLKPNSTQFKKTVEWLGTAKAIEIFEQLKTL